MATLTMNIPLPDNKDYSVKVYETNSVMDKEQIENVVQHIMIEDDPDRHCDGYDVITDFIMSLLENKGNDWKEKYYSVKRIKK